MGEVSVRVGALLHEVAETHHRVFRITDGEDADWASWYADWLLSLSELPTLLGTKPNTHKLGLHLCYSPWRAESRMGEASERPAVVRSCRPWGADQDVPTRRG